MTNEAAILMALSVILTRMPARSIRQISEAVGELQDQGSMIDLQDRVKHTHRVMQDQVAALTDQQKADIARMLQGIGEGLAGDAIFYIEADDLALLIADAKRAGRESMREEAAKRCKSVADCYGENVNNPNLGVTGQKAMLHKQAAAMDCYNAIRNLPISEEGEHSND